MKNIITGHFPSADQADPNIFYFNYYTRVGRTYIDNEITSYEAWVANEGQPPYIDSNNDGVLDIREPSYNTLENVGYDGGPSYTRPAYGGQGPITVSVSLTNPGPSLFNNTGQGISFIAEDDGIIVRFNGSINTFLKGGSIILNDGDTVIYDIFVDSDGDGVSDNLDAFPNDPNESIDLDQDGVGANTDVDDTDSNRASGIDTDGDGKDDEFDNNPNDGPLADSDGDGVINVQDAYINDPKRASGIDTDGDGTDDEFDNNPNDGPLGDADGDGILNQADADHSSNSSEPDSDGDGIIDSQDPNNEDGPLGDADGDGISNQADADHPSNTSEPDSDGDGIIDSQDPNNEDGPLGDADGDGVLNQSDADHSSNSSEPDSDGDGIIDSQDPNNEDGPLGDADGDGISNQADADHPSNTSEPDSDGDGIIDSQDPNNEDGPLGDADGDGVLNQSDADHSSNSSEPDSDGDGIIDSQDPNNEDGPLGDADGDGISNQADADHPSNTSEPDSDGDGIIDSQDPNNEDGPLGDADGDGVINTQDAYINDPQRASGIDTDGDGTDDEFDNDPNDGPLADADGDGILNQADADHPSNTSEPDSDGDGIIDSQDPDNEDGPLGDADGDGISNQADVDHPSNTSEPDSDGDGIIDSQDPNNEDGPLGDADGDGVINQNDSYTSQTFVFKRRHIPSQDIVMNLSFNHNPKSLGIPNQPDRPLGWTDGLPSYQGWFISSQPWVAGAAGRVPYDFSSNPDPFRPSTKLSFNKYDFNGKAIYEGDGQSESDWNIPLSGQLKVTRPTDSGKAYLFFYYTVVYMNDNFFHIEFQDTGPSLTAQYGEKTMLDNVASSPNSGAGTYYISSPGFDYHGEQLPLMNTTVVDEVEITFEFGTNIRYEDPYVYGFGGTVPNEGHRSWPSNYGEFDLDGDEAIDSYDTDDDGDGVPDIHDADHGDNIGGVDSDDDGILDEFDDFVADKDYYANYTFETTVTSNVTDFNSSASGPSDHITAEASSIFAGQWRPFPGITVNNSPVFKLVNSVATLDPIDGYLRDSSGRLTADPTFRERETPDWYGVEGGSGPFVDGSASVLDSAKLDEMAKMNWFLVFERIPYDYTTRFYYPGDGGGAHDGPFEYVWNTGNKTNPQNLSSSYFNGQLVRGNWRIVNGYILGSYLVDPAGKSIEDPTSSGGPYSYNGRLPHESVLRQYGFTSNNRKNNGHDLPDIQIASPMWSDAYDDRVKGYSSGWRTKVLLGMTSEYSGNPFIGIPKKDIFGYPFRADVFPHYNRWGYDMSSGCPSTRTSTDGYPYEIEYYDNTKHPGLFFWGQINLNGSSEYALDVKTIDENGDQVRDLSLGTGPIALGTDNFEPVIDLGTTGINNYKMVITGSNLSYVNGTYNIDTRFTYNDAPVWMKEGGDTFIALKAVVSGDFCYSNTGNSQYPATWILNTVDQVKNLYQYYWAFYYAGNSTYFLDNFERRDDWPNIIDDYSEVTPRKIFGSQNPIIGGSYLPVGNHWKDMAKSYPGQFADDPGVTIKTYDGSDNLINTITG